MSMLFRYLLAADYKERDAEFSSHFAKWERKQSGMVQCACGIETSPTGGGR